MNDDPSFQAQFLRDLRDELISDGEMTKNLSDYIESLIEYKISVALDNFDPTPYEA